MWPASVGVRAVHWYMYIFNSGFVSAHNIRACTVHHGTCESNNVAGWVRACTLTKLR